MRIIWTCWILTCKKHPGQTPHLFCKIPLFYRRMWKCKRQLSGHKSRRLNNSKDVDAEFFCSRIKPLITNYTVATLRNYWLTVRLNQSACSCLQRHWQSWFKDLLFCDSERKELTLPFDIIILLLLPPPPSFSAPFGMNFKLGTGQSPTSMWKLPSGRWGAERA